MLTKSTLNQMLQILIAEYIETCECHADCIACEYCRKNDVFDKLKHGMYDENIRICHTALFDYLQSESEKGK